MSRPIVWSLGTLATLAVAWTVAGDRFAEGVGLSSPRLGAVETGAPVRVLTVSADLRGHYVVHPTLDGRRLRMLVDTGASLVALSHEDAQLVGIKVSERDFTGRSTTANGIVRYAPVRIAELRVGDIAVRNVEAAVLPPGALGTSLLGMSFLKRLGGFEIAGGRLTLRS